MQFDTNVLRKLQTPLRMQVNGASGACAGMNFNGYAASSFLVTIVTQTAATNGYAWHVTATIPYDSRNCRAAISAARRWRVRRAMSAPANVGSMAVWSPADNSVYGGPDAGGSSIVATSGDPVQWWNSVVNNYADPNCSGCNTAFQHALRTTLGQPDDLGARDSSGIAVRGRRTSADAAGQLHADQSDSVHVELQPRHQRAGRLRVSDCRGSSVAPGCSFHIVFTGLTGSWAVLNDNVDHTNTFYATAVQDSYHFTIPVDGRSLGAGTLEWQSVHDVRLGALRHALPPEAQLQRRWISARAD